MDSRGQQTAMPTLLLPENGDFSEGLDGGTLSGNRNED